MAVHMLERELFPHKPPVPIWLFEKAKRHLKMQPLFLSFASPSVVNTIHTFKRIHKVLLVYFTQDICFLSSAFLLFIIEINEIKCPG